jgi:hypothetical protein
VHVYGVELRWGLLDNAPRSVEDLKNFDFDTVSPYTFEEVERGKELYICPWWENNMGERQLFHENRAKRIRCPSFYMRVGFKIRLAQKPS